jgi:predicted Rossmann fold nucleotide-binding protein DprA/Smf involved in DNA uptake
MKLAIVGTRSFTNYEAFVREVERILSERKLTPSVIVSGGAKGADTLAERYAKDKSLALEVTSPTGNTKAAAKSETNASSRMPTS